MQVQAREIQKQNTQLELTRQVRSFYYQVKYLQHNRKQLKQLDSLFTDFIRIAELRYKTGDTKKLDISSAQARKGEISLLYQQNEVYLKNAYQSLHELLNTQELLSVPEDDRYQPITISTVVDTSFISGHPSVKALYQNASIAEQQKKVERAQGLPDFSLGYTNQSLTGNQMVNGQEQFFGAGRRFSFVNVGITIPLAYGATRSRVRSLDYQKQAALAEARQQALRLRAQYENALEQYQQDIAQFNYYQNTALRNADEMIAAAQLGYRTGDIGYVEYLYTLQTATDIRLNYLKSVQQVNQSVIHIYSLINQ
ncbi:TolC family protein [Niabella hibiscisoli]|uniref:TolC family protein n=1 Tax=Niabella hibiscisoli TaxID=1825928 RepID=UPI001F1131A7|nr:TolC family protein [Niabella hibiscisoli]MCH5717967.1 TolC family protein [Niabella hibiscisoli]